ncbi:MAG TPA: ABC transporter permease subunit [Clostridiales bacterium]|nr:ABC transporter permease subunit [Clostridiales bacterium]
MKIEAINRASITTSIKQSPFIRNFKNEIFMHALVLPTVVYFFIFAYMPMYGILVAFKDFSFAKGIWGSNWVGLEHFMTFFKSMYFPRLVKNTVLISVYSIIWGMPFPIIFALLLNEIKNRHFKRIIQTVSYFPHFVSTVIIVGLMVSFMSPVDGIVNILRVRYGHEAINFIQSTKWFRTLYIGSGIWQGFGWGSIIYLAALSGISNELYEAAYVDGATRWQQTIHISIPGIMPTFIILFILSVGGIMSVGSSKIILMYTPATYDVADVISTYVYRKSLIGGEFSFGAAVGLFNTVINYALVFVTNKISKKVSDISLW